MTDRNIATSSEAPRRLGIYAAADGTPPGTLGDADGSDDLQARHLDGWLPRAPWRPAPIRRSTERERAATTSEVARNAPGNRWRGSAYEVRQGYSTGVFRQLWPSEEGDYLDHLKRLDPAGRRQRFHGVATDDALAAHAAKVFRDDRTHVIGWFHRGVLHGAAEIAFIDAPAGAIAEAAFALEAAYRGRGVGKGLMRRSVLHARNGGARRLHIATNRENRPMLRLAMGSGAKFEISATEAEGYLTPGPRTLYSLCLETMADEAGVLGWLWDRAKAWLAEVWRRPTSASLEPR